jgi:hypothetical protein
MEVCKELLVVQLELENKELLVLANDYLWRN